MIEHHPFAAEPVRHPVMMQGWKDLTHVHFSYDPEVSNCLHCRGA
jgi:hypothetical protein